MAKLPIKAMTDAEAAAEKKRLQAIKGDNYDTAQFYITSKSYVSVKIRQSVRDYFGIDTTVDVNATKWSPRQKKSESGGTRLRNDAEGFDERTGVPRGKLIKFPVNPESLPKDQVVAQKGKLGKQKSTSVNRRFYWIRVPHATPLAAIVIWVNTQFKNNKPPYFITNTGKKYYINPNYKDKSKLLPIGADSGKTREDAPDDKFTPEGEKAQA